MTPTSLRALAICTVAGVAAWAGLTWAVAEVARDD